MHEKHTPMQEVEFNNV